jgi:hypothetical protein
VLAFIEIFEIVLVFILGLFFLTQIIVPTWKGSMWFPSFRSEVRWLEKRLRHARLHNEIAEEKKRLARLEFHSETPEESDSDSDIAPTILPTKPKKRSTKTKE